MAATTTIAGFESPTASFDEPFEMLEACHDRLRRSLALLERLRRHLTHHGADEQARQAALDVLRYFTVAAPLHHEDEERHVVPLLRRSGQHALGEAANQLMQDHEQIRLVWRTLEPLLREAARGESPQPHRLAGARAPAQRGRAGAGGHGTGNGAAAANWRRRPLRAARELDAGHQAFAALRLESQGFRGPT